MKLIKLTLNLNQWVTKQCKMSQIEPVIENNIHVHAFEKYLFSNYYKSRELLSQKARNHSPGFLISQINFCFFNRKS